MILAHAQFVLRTPVDTFEFVRHVILEGGATAKETPVAEAEPDAIAESGPQPKVSIFRKTNCACAKIIAVRNFATSRKIAVASVPRPSVIVRILIVRGRETFEIG